MGTATASAADSGPLSRAWTAGAEAAVNDDESLLQNIKSAVLVSVAEAPSRAANLAAGAVMLLITLMMVLLAALVGGEFAAAIPSDSTFSDAINTTTDNAGTAFVIFGVSLLAIPTVSVLAYIVLKLGPFIGFSGMGGGGLMNRR
jgi:hypothetical protein